MDPDRRRRIARELLDAIDSIPIGVDGPGGFDVTDLIATTKLEAELIGQLTDAMEIGHTVQVALDAALTLIEGGGWRHVSLAELRGDEAEQLYRLFANQSIADK
jgi:hypothetical protein